MTAFYIIGSCFFIWAVIISVVGFMRHDFPGRSIVPISAVSVLLCAATLTAVIYGGIQEGDEEGSSAEPAGQTAAE